MPISNYVKITANTVYGGSNIGFREVKIFGCFTGKIALLGFNGTWQKPFPETIEHNRNTV